jgi:hypothetical protein
MQMTNVTYAIGQNLLPFFPKISKRLPNCGLSTHTDPQSKAALANGSIRRGKTHLESGQALYVVANVWIVFWSETCGKRGLLAVD